MKYFYISLIIIALFMCMSFGIDFEFFMQKDEGIPSWFLYLLGFVDIITATSLLAINFFRKAGVFMFPFFVLLHFLLYTFYLETWLYFDVFTLFLFIGIGLLAIIPRWKYFK